MAFKLLISGESNSGKTSLTKDLTDALVINHDGKSYPFKIPHGTIEYFQTAEELIAFVEEKAAAYEAKFKKLPSTVVFDSVSRVYETLYNSCSKRFTGFQVFSQLDKEIKEFVDFVQELVVNGVNVIIISHALYDAETGKSNLVGKGSFSKIGGFLSTVDDSIYIETKKGNKRIVHFRSTVFPARTLNDELPDSINVEDYSLQKHIETLGQQAEEAQEYAL